MMKALGLVSLGGLLARTSAFQLLPARPTFTSNTRGVSSRNVLAPSSPRATDAAGRPITSKLDMAYVDISESAPRDIGTFDEWATACGVQRAPSFQLAPEDEYYQNVGVMTSDDLPAGSPVLYVPAEMILSSSGALAEIGQIPAAEQRLVSAKAADHVPQFYLFLKVLMEYEKGDASPWYPWLNSVPRYYSSGSSMTPFCFDCLPPLASELASGERIKFIQFFQALSNVDFLSEETKNSKDLARWAFAVVYTRGFPTEDGDFKLVPMGDMFNHGPESDIDITYDENGNYCAYAARDVPAGSPLRMVYGDPTNPSFLLARYGFLDKDSPASFCKIKIRYPSQELKNMGYDHSRMLFYKDTGVVSEEVWDVLLYRLLQDNPQEQQTFYQAHMNGDYGTKQSFHERYYPQTREALLTHVDDLLEELDTLTNKGVGRDVNEHPRLPLIMSHNEFVKETFLNVKANL